jgi:hypothetical protein
MSESPTGYHPALLLKPPLGGHFGTIVTAVYAAILREVATKGTKARFRKTAPGHFAFNTESTKD